MDSAVLADNSVVLERKSARLLMSSAALLVDSAQLLMSFVVGRSFSGSAGQVAIEIAA